MYVAQRQNTSNLFGQSLKMSNTEYENWRKFIYEVSGIYFQDGKKYLLESRLQRRVKFLKFDSFEKYYNYIKFNPRGKSELKYLLDAITINETFFFRNQPQLDALASRILPEMIKEKRRTGQRKVKIWSAASSSGEEAYSVAMMIHELIKPSNRDFSFEIVGTDINSQVIETARRGIYRDYAVRNTPKYFLKKYFKQTPMGYELDPVIKQYATFKLLNLYDNAAMRMMRGFDVIFCANVLIYFDMKSKMQVVNHLYNALNRGGYLFVGYSETLHGISKAFKIVSFSKTVGYKKE